ncbi:MAG: AAA family ATPase [Rhodoluna sp.]|nr:AAA family ATPase [Rhodoluna sp.]MBP6186264.1 AAA family ATPase [Rhodoluna sp.]
MVVLHPIDASSESYGELAIIDAFRSSAAHPEIHVIHSLKLTSSPDRLEGEADFVVLIPGRGIVVVEAKAPTGGEVADGRMHLTGLPDNAKDPFAQASQVRNEMIAYLDEHAGMRVPIARCVWLSTATPDGIKNFHGDANYKLYELLTANDLTAPEEALIEVIDAYNQEHASKNLYDQPAKFDANKAEIARKALQAEFTIQGNKSLISDARSRELEMLEERQKEDLDLVLQNKHTYFYGPAGTGKSLMVTETAIRGEESGERVLLTCWNKMLASELSDEYSEAFPNMHVQDLGALMAEIAGVTDPEGAGNEWFTEQLPKLAIEAAGELEGEFDLIAVDEYQDIAAYPVMLQFLEKLGKNQSWADTRLVLAGDKYQQIMRNGEFAQDPYGLAKRFVADLTNVKLKKNYRNAKRIGEALVKLTNNGATYDKYARTTSTGEIEIIEVDNNTAPRQLLRAIEKLQSSYTDHEIRVLSPSRADNSMPKLILDLPDSALRPEIGMLKSILKDNVNHTGVIPWRSIQKYKGLESDAVIITDINEEQWNKWKSRDKSLFEMLYVGFSRAHHHVVVLCDNFMSKKLRELDL